eukprot:m.202837 g.202837  ORF g.202837 m.202837 type:complete len:978 (+) comp32835_c1_seq2:283-3216(+)
MEEPQRHSSVAEEVRLYNRWRRASKIKAILACILLVLTVVSFGLYVETANAFAPLTALCSGVEAFLIVVAVAHGLILLILVFFGVSFWRKRRDVYGPLTKSPRLIATVQSNDVEDQDDELLEADVLRTQKPRKAKKSSSAKCCLHIMGGLAIFVLVLVVILNVVVYELVVPRVGTLKLPKRLSNVNMNDSVTIEYGPQSQIHIHAKTKWDMYFAQGLVTAQQRLWQMEFQRRVGNGNLAQVVGVGALDTDIMMRTLGFDRAAKEAVVSIRSNPKVKAADLALRAFTMGVNAYLDSNPALPLEFLVLGHSPEKWNAEDSMVWFKVMSLDLSGNMALEMQRFKLLTEQCVPHTRVEQLLPKFNLKEFPTVLRDSDPLVCEPPKFDNYSKTCNEAQPELDFINKITCANKSEAEQIPREGRRRRFSYAWDNTQVGGKMPLQASNNWVTSNTKSGLPLLCNDPHLQLLAPSIWLLFHLEAEEGNFSVIGATFAGAPGIVIGRNKHIAWGVTNTGVDVQDLFYFEDDHIPTGFNVTLRTEMFQVSGQRKPESKIIRIISGPNGVIGPVMTDNGVNTVKSGVHLALKYVSIDPSIEDFTFAAFVKMNEATDYESFRDALRWYVAPAQNFVFASTNGDIGYQMPGKVPVRVGYTGKYPTNLANATNPWVSYVDFDDMPHTLNPPRGFIASANNQVVPPCYAENISVLSCDWDSGDGYRAGRIEQLLETTLNHTVDTMKDIQLDYVSHVFRDLKPIINFTCRYEQSNPVCESLLGTNGHYGWDGNSSVGSQEATVFAHWFVQILSLPKAEVGINFWDNVPFLVSSLNASFYNVSDCCGVNTSTQYQQFATSVTQNVAASLDFGNLPRWGEDIHKALFVHTIFNGTDMTQCIGNRATKHGGGHATVNVGSYEYDDPLFTQDHGPSYRQIVDFSDDFAHALYLNPLGQSGVILDAHYDDLLPLWSDGKYLEMVTTGYEVTHTDTINK